MKRVSGKDFCRALRRAGWTFSHISGSHHIDIRPGQAGHVSVPVHGNQTLRKGTQAQLMKDAGLTEADL